MSSVRSSKYRGILSDPGPGVGMTLVPSLLLHIPMLFLFVLADCDPRPPAPVDRDVFMVSAVVLPKSVSLPTKAAAPKPKAAGEAGKKVKEAPIIEDQMVLKEKKKEKDEGPEKEPPKKKEKEPEPKKEPKRDLSALLASVEEESDEVIFETSPDGDPNAKPEAGARSAYGRQLTAYERQVRDRVQYNWFPKGQRTPLPEDIWASVVFRVEANGAIADPRIGESSGDFVFDQSCLRAVMRTRTVPPPGSNDNRTISVGFSPKDKQ